MGTDRMGESCDWIEAAMAWLMFRSEAWVWVVHQFDWAENEMNTAFLQPDSVTA